MYLGSAVTLKRVVISAMTNAAFLASDAYTERGLSLSEDLTLGDGIE